MACVPFLCKTCELKADSSWLGTHSLSLPPASGVPQLVEPVLWDYGADLDVHGKGQYLVARGGPFTLTAQWGVQGPPSHQNQTCLCFTGGPSRRNRVPGSSPQHVSYGGCSWDGPS